MMRGVIMVVAVMITPLSAVAQTRYDDVQREEATGDQDPSGRFGMIESRTMASSPQVEPPMREVAGSVSANDARTAYPLLSRWGG
jgi:hypothetical protein